MGRGLPGASTRRHRSNLDLPKNEQCFGARGLYMMMESGRAERDWKPRDGR